MGKSPTSIIVWIEAAAAVFLLNLSLTFVNVWPTPAIIWRGGLSLEFALYVLALCCIAEMRNGVHPRRLVAWISAVWVLLVLGRYADVTAPALYGRDINLYWDLRFIPDVVSMVTRVAPLWLLVVALAGVVLFVVMLYAIVGWAWRRVADMAATPNPRRTLAALAMAAVILFAAARVSGRGGADSSFPTPVVETYARQIRLVATAVAAPRSLAPSPPMSSDLSRIAGADVLLIFIESYGAVAYDRPTFASGLAGRRAEFEAAIHDTHRASASAFVESPTFGGGSWLAHISLLSGIEVRDPDTNALLMTQRRDTMAKAFARRGYRTVAWMPGMRQRWPEGRFYGFDDIYGADRLAYRGPEFGWFAIPDQYSLDRLDAFEVNRPSRQPLFVFFPTISTHFPFSPTPPYQPDWRRLTDPHPYDGPDIVRAYAREPNWVDFGPGYVDALSYDFTSIAGYLRKQADRDMVMIVLGDHQPPAAVSGEHASWDVPVHVIAGRQAVLDRLVSHGFQRGFTPRRPSLGRMHTLLPMLLEAFGDSRP
jgi:hypothetical protein